MSPRAGASRTSQLQTSPLRVPERRYSSAFLWRPALSPPVGRYPSAGTPRVKAMTEMFRFCDDFVTRWAALDPIGIGGVVAEPFRAATDYSPSGHEAWADLMTSALAALGGVPVTSDHDRLAAVHLRERLEAQLAWNRAGEPLRDLRTPFGPVS